MVVAVGVTLDIPPDDTMPVTMSSTSLTITAVPPKPLVNVEVRFVLLPKVIVAVPAKDAVGSGTTMMVMLFVTVPCALLTVRVNIVVVVGDTLIVSPDATVTVPGMLSMLPVPPLNTGMISILSLRVMIVEEDAVKLVIDGAAGEPPPHEVRITNDSKKNKCESGLNT